MGKDYYSTTTAQSSPLPATDKKTRRRQRGGLFSSLARTATQEQTEGKRKVLPMVLSVVLWVGLACGGYAFANYTLEKNQAQLEQRIDEIEKTNAQQVALLEEQMNDVQDEMEQVKDGLSSIQEDLELTGEAIGGTNKTKEALQDRIDQLNSQLTELKASLKKLEDAARAW
ncbi:hypothetical protein [Brevibacillus fulvus]|uniref:Chromosome segregation ATPase n=1 Tax=Brevibacillus fulvus TaxID=1125967 RepID=A0A938Y560_9BACL|nr:hypothetical protein [Brevibacillus fulvus]MBM7591430.1 chromosome segregation ATPase [Brevibacillus fulvus]